MFILLITSPLTAREAAECYPALAREKISTNATSYDSGASALLIWIEFEGRGGLTGLFLGLQWPCCHRKPLVGGSGPQIGNPLKLLTAEALDRRGSGHTAKRFIKCAGLLVIAQRPDNKPLQIAPGKLAPRCLEQLPSQPGALINGHQVKLVDLALVAGRAVTGAPIGGIALRLAIEVEQQDRRTKTEQLLPPAGGVRRDHLLQCDMRDEPLIGLMAFHWPGNVRQLENVLLRASVLAPADRIRAEDILLPDPVAPANALTREAFEQQEMQQIADALAAHRWNVAQVARVLGIPRPTLYRKLKRYGLVRGRPA